MSDKPNFFLLGVNLLVMFWITVPALIIAVAVMFAIHPMLGQFTLLLAFYGIMSLIGKVRS